MFVRVLFLVLVALTPLYGQQRLLTTSEVLKREGPAVVLVEILDKEGKLTGQASGVALLSEGVIVTNFHVIEDACDVRVRFAVPGLHLNDGTLPPDFQLESTLVTSLVATDKDNDLALLRVGFTGLPVATVGKSSQLKPGDVVVAIGNPMGLEQSVSEGIVSGIRRTGSGYWIQTTAPISPGSSGGGLYSRSGELVGITSLTLRESQNLNFAVPVERAQAVLAESSKASSELRWGVASRAFCKETKTKLDSAPIIEILGRTSGDPMAQALLKGLNGGVVPEPYVTGSPKWGEYRGYYFTEIGVEIIFVDGRAVQVNLLGNRVYDENGVLRHEAFPGILPFGVSWSDTRQTLTSRFGMPVESRPFRGVDEADRPRDGWLVDDVYHLGPRWYHFCYTESGELVTIEIL